MNGTPGSRFCRRCQSNGLAEPARPRRLARRARVEQQMIGNCRISARRRQDRLGLDRDRLHHRQAERFLSAATRVGRLLAVKLQQIRLQRLDHGIKHRIVGIDRQRHFLRAAAYAAAERPRGLEDKMPRRWRKEHEADHVGARVERDVERLGRRKAADFDDHDIAQFSLASPRLRIYWRPSTSPRGALSRLRPGVCSAGLWAAASVSGGLSCSRSAGSAAFGMPAGMPLRLRVSISARRSATSRSSRRAVRRHLVWRSQAAMPPIDHAENQQHDDQRKQRQVTDAAGTAGLNGSSETVTSCRFATAKAMMTMASGTRMTAATTLRSVPPAACVEEVKFQATTAD